MIRVFNNWKVINVQCRKLEKTAKKSPTIPSKETVNNLMLSFVFIKLKSCFSLMSLFQHTVSSHSINDSTWHFLAKINPIYLTNFPLLDFQVVSNLFPELLEGTPLSLRETEQLVEADNLTTAVYKDRRSSPGQRLAPLHKLLCTSSDQGGLSWRTKGDNSERWSVWPLPMNSLPLKWGSVHQAAG